MATHSRTLAWKIPQMEEPGHMSDQGVTKSGTRLSDFIHSVSIGEEILLVK